MIYRKKEKELIRIFTPILIGVGVFGLLWAASYLLQQRKTEDMTDLTVTKLIALPPEVQLKKAIFEVVYNSEEIFKDKWPQVCRTDSKGNLYVVEIANRQIIKLDPTGLFLKAWGRRGQGPGEFGGLARLFVDENDNIWLSDVANSRVILFDSDGNYKQMITFNERPFNLVMLRDSTFVIATLKISQFLVRYNYQGHKIDGFGSHLTVSHLINQGRFIVDDNNRLFYSYDYLSPILVYQPDGKLLFKIDGPIKIPPPEKALKDENYQLNGEERFATLDMCISGPHLFVLFSGIAPMHPLVRQRVIEATESDIIHVYEKDTGKYLYTLRLPVLVKFFFIDKLYLYCISYEPTVRVIKYKFSI